MTLPQPPPDEPWTLSARWVFPVERPPLARGTVTIRNHEIVAVEEKGCRTPDLDLGNAAILPGLVNAHTHLDLSDALGKCPPTHDFADWLRNVIEHRRRQTPEDVARAIDIGLTQCLRYGTTLVGDISVGGTSWDRLAGAPLQAIVFYELIGLTAERAAQAYAGALAWLRSHPQTQTCFTGLSPHAPYTVRLSLLEKVVELSLDMAGKGRFVPVALHLAETAAELQLLKTHTGRLRTLLDELGAWDGAGLVPDSDAVLRVFDKSGAIHPSLFVHCNYLKCPPAHGAVVYCPRTHAAFSHGPHPWMEFLEKGACVALGTDSLASNPDLDVLAEARFLHQNHPDFSGPKLLEMATLNGAKALGLDCRTGSLKAGKWADLVVLPLPETFHFDPHCLVFESTIPVQATLFRGRWR